MAYSILWVCFLIPKTCSVLLCHSNNSVHCKLYCQCNLCGQRSANFSVKVQKSFIGHTVFVASLEAQIVKVSVYNAGFSGWIPGLGRSPGEGNGNPLQYSCLKNPVDRGSAGRKELDTTERLHFLSFFTVFVTT